MFGFGLPEAIILGIIILLLFGRRLPALFGSLGASLPAFKKGLAGDEPRSPNDSPRKLDPPTASDSV